MTESISDVLSYSELELTVNTYERSKIEDLGTLGWYQAHERMQKLSQQAMVEIRSGRTENVIGLLSANDKVGLLVHEGICIRVWREKVLPHILATHLSETAHGFMPYLIMFHEAVAVSLLETILYSAEACSALGDSASDLVDFVAQSLTRLVGFPESHWDQDRDVGLGTREQLEQQQRSLEFSISTRCISILRYLATNIDCLPVNAVARMLDTHDLPVVLAALLDSKPWVQKDPRTELEHFFQDDEWRPASASGEMPRCEAQAWLALHQLLLSPVALSEYQLQAQRLTALAKLQRLLVESVVDQLSPLLELQHWLIRVQSAGAAPTPTRQRPVILELQPEIRAAVEAGRTTKKWKALASKQSERLFGVELMQQVASRMSDTYDLELLDSLRPTMRRCSSCGAETTQRCSRCKTFYYCTRACQVRDWKKHKVHCDKIMQSASGDH